MENKKWYKAHIKWFDNVKGEGVVFVPELEKSIFVHYSADVRAPYIFITYEKLEIIEVQIVEDSHYTQVSKLKSSNWITKEDLLCDKLLEFFDSFEIIESNLLKNSWYDWCLYNLITWTED